MVRYLTVLIAFIFILKLSLLNAQPGPWRGSPYGYPDPFDHHGERHGPHHDGRGNHGGSRYCAALLDPETRPVAIPASGKHTATVIFLHGLGNAGNIWPPMFVNGTKAPHVKNIIPYAASRLVTAYGQTMPAWFDIYGLSPESPEDIDGIERAVKCVHSLIDAEIRPNVPSQRIVLGGVSMGGALALYAGLTYDKPLAGIIGLSAFLIRRDLFNTTRVPRQITVNRNVPIFMGHGDQDDVILPAFGNLTADRIKKFNPNVEMKTYQGMNHSISTQELQDVRQFLAKHLPPQRLPPNAGPLNPFNDKYKYRPYGHDQRW